MVCSVSRKDFAMGVLMIGGMAIGLHRGIQKGREAAEKKFPDLDYSSSKKLGKAFQVSIISLATGGFFGSVAALTLSFSIKYFNQK